VIAEGAVIGVFENSHELDNVVTEAADTIYHVLSERLEAVHLWFDTAHSYVALVNLEALVRPFWVFVLEVVPVFNVHSVIAEISVLMGETNPRWNTVLVSTVTELDVRLNL